MRNLPTHYDMYAFLQNSHVISNERSTDARMYFNPQKISKLLNNLWKVTTNIKTCGEIRISSSTFTICWASSLVGANTKA